MTDTVLDLNIEEHEPISSFNRIAHNLLTCCYIKTANCDYFITEIEFYYGTDPFIHGHATQLLGGLWYFHWSGIDITIGNSKTKGSILIRGVKKKSNGNNWEYINGPLKVMRELLSGQSSIFSEEGFKLQLIARGVKAEERIYCGCRIGLNPKLDPENKFILQNLRFLIDKDIAGHKFRDKSKPYQLVEYAVL